METELQTLDGSKRAIPHETIAEMTAGLRGTAATVGQPGYEEARTIWNAMVDRRPGLVIRARGVTDIVAAVNFARDNGLLIAVRSGGHQIGGFAVADGALQLDLSEMRSVHVDPVGRTARVEPGATLGDVDAATQLFGLAVPTGINSSTGIAGLTLGGGFGWLTRKYGMTVDNLLSADVATADGSLLRVSPDEHPDLFWAIRGGGGNFGVVTSFEFRLHEIGTQVLSGLLIHPIEDAVDLLRGMRGICASAPDELTVWAVLRKAPPLPFLPEEWHGRGVMIFAACYTGDMAEGERATQDLRALGKPIVDVIAPHPFTAWQAAFDPLLTPGARNYWKSHDFLDLEDETITAVLNAMENLPDPQCEVFIAQIGGAMARVAPDATAFAHRAAHYTMNVHTRWDDADKDAACLAWARDLFAKTASQATGSVYVNFMPDDDGDRIGGAYGANIARLREVKATYDPGNLFRVNHNIMPAADVKAAQ